MKKRRFKPLNFIINMLIVLMLVASFSFNTFADTKTAALNTRNLAMLNKPGVVLIETMWTADLTLYEFSFISEFEDDLVETIALMIDEGTIANDEISMYSAMVQLMIDNMEYYMFDTGNIYTEKATTSAVGTGFIITQDGYLVTNAHVVHTDADQLNYNFVVSTLQDYAIDGTYSFVQEMRTLGYEMSQEEIDAMMNTFFNMLAYNIEIDNLQTNYSCYMGNTVSGGEVTAKNIKLDLRYMGEPIPGKDVAILKLDKINLPTVYLGDDSKMRTGDKVYAMGYPAVVTITDTLNINQAIQEPTLTSGIISARKEMAGGWSIFQTDAAIHGGNSGGPLFNESGEVIGINTFGMLDWESGAQVAGMNFAIPISIASQFLHEINVVPSESKFTEKLKKALLLFQNEDYANSLEILRGLNETNPGYPVVVELLAEARDMADQISENKPATEVDNPAPEKNNSGVVFAETHILIAASIIIVVLAALAVVILLIALSKKKKRNINNQNAPQSQVATGPAVKPVSTDKVDDKNIFCSNCGKSITADSKFCGGCGKPNINIPKTPLKCVECNNPVNPDHMFCDNCGAKVSKEEKTPN